jgi:hypothetical protein
MLHLAICRMTSNYVEHQDLTMGLPCGALTGWPTAWRHSPGGIQSQGQAFGNVAQ